MKQFFDVIIVGAGPAGLSASIALARKGLHVLICEQSKLPKRKSCGEGIMPGGHAALAKLDIDTHKLSLPHRRFSGVRFIVSDQIMALGQFSSDSDSENRSYGLAMERIYLSQLLLNRAKKEPNLKIYQETKVISFYTKPPLIEVTCQEESFLTRLVLLADGLQSRFFSQQRSIDKTSKRMGANVHYPIKPWIDEVAVYLQQGIEAYITPVGDYMTNIAFLWDKKRVEIGGGKNMLVALLDRFPEIKKRLQGIDPMDGLKASGPFARKVSSIAEDGVLLIGDSAGYLDAITGEGVSLALREALILEQYLVPLLENSNHKEMIKKSELANISQALKRNRRRYLHFTSVLLFLARRRLLIKWLVLLFSKRPKLFSTLLSGLHGKYSIVATYGKCFLALWRK